jgi:GTP-binding protein
MNSENPPAETPPGRVVAIVGRPNVGKSATFNRLARKRLAIVHAESGVTRDRLMREVTWEDERFELIDTGGVCNVDNAAGDNAIEQGIRDQVNAALGDAAVAILVVDITTGIHPMDEEVARILRQSNCKTFVACNKADGPEKDDDTDEYKRLGFPVFPVSALHGRGFDRLLELVVPALPEAKNETVEHPLKVAIVGRPNVGKSSYINRLLRSDRVIVSDVPGTTRDSVEIPFTVGHGEQARHYQLIDTAGIRRGGKIDTQVERYSSMRAEDSIIRADVVILALDATQGPSAQDKKIAAMIQEHNKGCMILVTKWDLAEAEVTQTQYGPAIHKTMPFMAHCPVIFSSSETGYNIRRTIDGIDHVASQISLTLPTGVLNRCIKEAYDAVRPPAYKGKPLKLYYCTQVGTEPLRIRFFVNNPALVRPQYRTYLARKLRESFGLEGAPLALHFGSRHRPAQGKGKGKGKGKGFPQELHADDTGEDLIHKGNDAR